MAYSIVLASSSPYRRELLNKLGLCFICESPNIDESPLANETADQLVRRLAVEKAKAIAANHPDSIVIASDQVAVLNGNILGKPGDHRAARQQLANASGNKVLFLTSLVVLNTNTGSQQLDVVPFAVHFRQLNDDEIEGYLRKEQPYNCAGSFKSEGLGVTLFQRLEGDDPNALIGLPLIKLSQMLENEGLSLY